MPSSPRSRRRSSLFADAVWSICSTIAAARASASCSKARRACCSTSITAPIPFVTSSNTVAAQAATGSGIGPGAARLCARHRQGLHHPRRLRPVPDRAGQRGRRALGARGREFGTVTGRKRRCGWFDAVLVRQTIKTSGIQGIALTKLDVLDGLERDQGVDRLHARWRAHRPPAGGPSAAARVEPVYERFEGWQTSTAGARSWAALPAQAIKYVRSIEELIECPVALALHQPRARRHDLHA